MALSHLAKAQVGIGTTSPDPSAILDLSANDKGLLIPRLSNAEIANIESPVSGLIIYNATFARFEYYDGFTWKKLKIDDGFPVLISNMEGDVRVNTEQNLAEKRITMHSANKQVVTIDTFATIVAPPLILSDEIYSTAKARLDIDGRMKLGDDNVAPAEAGMIRWNAAASDFEGFDGTEWQSLTRAEHVSNYGNTISYATPSSTEPLNAGTLYNGANIAGAQQKKISSYYNPDLGNVYLDIKDQDNSQTLSIQHPQSIAQANRLSFNLDWISYIDASEVLTWKLVNGTYIEQDPITSNLSSAKLLVGNRLLGKYGDASLTYFEVYTFNEDTNDWEVSDTEALVGTTYGSYIDKNRVALYGAANSIRTYDIIDGNFDPVSDVLLSDNPYNVAIDSNNVIVARKEANTNNIILEVRAFHDLQLLTSTTTIELPYINTSPLVNLTSKDGVLVVGIYNGINNQGIRCGRALVYDIEQGNLVFNTELAPRIQQEDMKFGRAISIEDDMIRVSAHDLDANGTVDHGSVYQYHKP